MLQMSPSLPHALAFLFFFALLSSLFVRRWWRRRGRQACRARRRLPLPPGSTGWPYVGETLQLYSQDPNVFFASRQKRHGEIFKTHLLGCPCVMLASPEASRFVLVTGARLFKPTYPRSKERIIGPWALFFHQGDYHTRVRRLVQGPLSPEALRRLLPDIEAAAVSMLDSWDGSLVAVFHAMKKFSFDVGIISIFGRQLDARYKEELKRNYFIVDKGYNSFPSYIAGTAYSKALVARRRLSETLRRIMAERREKGEGADDILGCLMASKDEKGQRHLSDDQIADNVTGVLFAAQDTTASVLTWILKYLHDDPELLESVQAEQMAIHQSNGCGERPLTWLQTRSMVLTQRVISETLRLASIISFTFREAVADVEYKGYTIPKGWKVLPLFRSVHHNPDFFPEPQKFDPSRFMVSPKPNTFLPFGNGVHACPGNELAKLEMLVLVHHLVVKYRWEIAGSDEGIEYSPFPVPKRGLPAKFVRLPSNGKRSQGQ